MSSSSLVPDFVKILVRKIKLQERVNLM